MALLLTIINAPDGVELKDHEKDKTFTAVGGSIGRSSKKSSWVLEDPNRYLSGCHLVIQYQQGQFILIDTSSNGVYINDTGAPLGKNNTHYLQNDDRLILGEYELLVNTDAPEPLQSPGVTPDSSTQVGLDMSSTDDNTVTKAPFQSIPSADSPAFDDEIENLLDKVSIAPANPTSDEGYGTPLDSLDDNIVNNLLDEPSVNSLNSVPDLTTDKPFWNEDTPNHSTVSGNSNPLIESVKIPGIVPNQAEPNIDLVSDLNKGQQQMPPSVDIGAPSSSVDEPQSISEDVRRLLKNLGFAEDAIPPDRAEELIDDVSAVLQETVNGLIKVLNSRTTVKDEFRMNITQIKSVDNNPLKFFTSPQDTLENMFIKEGEAYTSAAYSVKEGFSDITHHQMAVLAGMRAAYISLLKRFNPEKLEKRFAKKVKSGFFLSSKKAKYWDSFVDYYSSIVPNEDEAFQNLFGNEFVQAYEEQLRTLEAERDKKK